MSIDTFNKRRNIDDNFSEKKEFDILKVRIHNILKKINLDKGIGIQGVEEFCNELWIKIWNNYYDKNTYYWNNISAYFEGVSNVSWLAKWLELLTTVNKDYNINSVIEEIYNLAIIKSKIISWKLTEDGILITYPAWEKTLDEEVINNVLSFLNWIPWEHFTNALRSLWTWQSLEALRKCLEEYLRLILNNTKNYESNINELGKILKDRNIENVLKDMIINQLRSLEWYFNETSKHKTKPISIPENEYILYWVGNVLKIIHETL